MAMVVRFSSAAVLAMFVASALAQSNDEQALEQWEQEVKTQLIELFDANTNQKLDSSDIQSARARLRYLMEDTGDEALVIEEWRNDVRDLLTILDQNGDGELGAPERDDARLLLSRLLPKPREVDPLQDVSDGDSERPRRRARRPRSQGPRRTYGGVGHGATTFGPGLIGPPRPFHGGPRFFNPNATGTGTGQDGTDGLESGSEETAVDESVPPGYSGVPGDEAGGHEGGYGTAPEGAEFEGDYGDDANPDAYDDYEEEFGDSAGVDDEELFPEDEFAEDVGPMGDDLSETSDEYAEPEPEGTGNGEDEVRREDEAPPPAF